MFYFTELFRFFPQLQCGRRAFVFCTDFCCLRKKSVNGVYTDGHKLFYTLSQRGLLFKHRICIEQRFCRARCLLDSLLVGTDRKQLRIHSSVLSCPAACVREEVPRTAQL